MRNLCTWICISFLILPAFVEMFLNKNTLDLRILAFLVWSHKRGLLGMLIERVDELCIRRNIIEF